jgi:hypothetical protein
VDIGEVIVNSGIGSHIPCFSLDSASSSGHIFKDDCSSSTSDICFKSTYEALWFMNRGGATGLCLHTTNDAHAGPTAFTGLEIDVKY